MAGLFREVTITWKGEDYHVTPTMQLLRRIEGAGISITSMVQRLFAGDPVMSHMAYALTELLRAGGAKVSEDEVYHILGRGSADEASALSNALILAVTTQETDGKKPDAPAKD